MGDIKTRFALEGEQQFKSAMSSAAAAIKVLNSEQKLAKAQFQNTGNAEKYAADQARILKEKIEQQKTAVKAAEQALKQLADNGVAKNTRQYQQWQTKLNTAQTALVQMETELQNVNSTMEETTSTANETGDAISSIGKKVSFDAVIGGIGKITDKMEAAARKAKELATDLMTTMKDSAAWADDLATTATVYGISQEELQRMRYTADLLDTSVESIMKSRQKLINNMVYGNEEVQETFKTLGIATQEFTMGKYPKGTKIANADAETLMLQRPPPRARSIKDRPVAPKPEKMTWKKFYFEQPGMLNNLIIELVQDRAKARVGLKEWSNLMFGAALTMSTLFPDEPTVQPRVEELVNKAVEDFDNCQKLAERLFPKVFAKEESASTEKKDETERKEQDDG